MKTNKVAFILPRYGKSLGGGAETLAKSLVDTIKQYLQEFEVEVWTTCAKDHRTWENFFEEGEFLEDGVRVRRFKVSERDLEKFIPHEFSMRDGIRLSLEEQFEWLENSVNSLDLYHHIKEEGSNFDLLFFAPYLFGTSYWGSLIYPEKSILIPCLHNEAYAFLQVFSGQFQLLKGFIFNSEPEFELATKIFPVKDFHEKSEIIGMSFEEQDYLLTEEVKLQVQSNLRETKHFPENQKENSRYIIYAGRKEEGKGLDLLIDYFKNYQSLFPEQDLQLVLIGSGKVEFLKELPPNVLDLGFVSEDEKKFLIQNALLLCQPSVNESFSIVMMESWLLGTPVLVNAFCEVTKYHVEESKGGLYFAHSLDFAYILDEFFRRPELKKILADGGRNYVMKKYSLERITALLRSFMMKNIAP